MRASVAEPDRIWLFFAIVAIMVSFGACQAPSSTGQSSAVATPGPDRPALIDEGFFVEVEADRSRPTLTAHDEEEIQRLMSLGYVDVVKSRFSDTGVVTYDRTLAARGLNLYCSGHAPEAILMTMDGRVLHRWSLDVRELVPDLEMTAKTELGSSFFRRARLLPEGDLLVLFDYVAIARIDRNSGLKWLARGAFHHDIQVLDDGRILTLSEEWKDGASLGYPRAILDNSIVFLDPRGRELNRVSMIDCFAQSFSRDRLTPLFPEWENGDAFHGNSVQFIASDTSGGSRVYAPGNILVSFRTLSSLAVIDPKHERVRRLLRGRWRGQHEARLTDQGTILLFDNLGGVDHSRIIELDTERDAIVWEYQAEPPAGFFSRFQGTLQRLNNGNTLIVESTGARAFEVTPGLEIVWEFHSPHRSHDRSDLVAVLFDMTRVSEDAVRAWLDRGEAVVAQ